MITTFLSFLENRGRKRIIFDRQHNEPYLERYYLLLKKRNRLPFNIFLHKFLKGDVDEHLHDHPWNYITIVLKGGYWEITPNGKYWRGAGHIRRCTATSMHRIELEPGVDCWTLFIPGIRKREWGFDVDGLWTHYKTYLRERYGKACN